MDILCFNYRGIGQPETVREIYDLIRLHRPALVFLSETKVSDKRAQDLKLRLGFSNAFGVKARGLSGGLVLYWNNESLVSLKSFSNSHIDVFVRNEDTGEKEWRFTGFYGEPARSKRKNSWELLQYLRREYDHPWLCAGDFNEVLDASEQFGGNDREEWKMEGFRDTVDYCRFIDLGFSGLPYTWDNRQQGRCNVKVRLDRGMADDKFLELFDNTFVQHIQTSESDHCALLLRTQRSVWDHDCSRNKPFRFENAWTRHERYEEVVVESWQPQANDLAGVYDALNSVRQKLQKWSREEFGSVQKQLKAMRHRLERVRAASLRSGPTRAEKDLLKRISELLARKEALTKQRSRVLWLSEGDRNTEFFHAKMKERSRINKIKKLKKPDGSVAMTQPELETLAMNFYSDLFTAQHETRPELVTDWVPNKVTEAMNVRLCAPISNEEIENALFMMHTNKAPGPDGFTAGFYIRHWYLLKDVVCDAIHTFLEGGEMPEIVNSTVLVLIPKIKNPQDLTQYRPISLCNVLYKLASKVLALRLRPVLDDIIAEEQSAFVPGRLISDDVLTAYECIHYLKKKKGKSGDMAVKLDMAKAYDRVEWTYLRAMMEKLGFAAEWIDRVMVCVQTVSFSIRVNGQFLESFRPTKAIRQADPISPFLFLICAEDEQFVEIPWPGPAIPWC